MRKAWGRAHFCSGAWVVKNPSHDAGQGRRVTRQTCHASLFSASLRSAPARRRHSSRPCGRITARTWASGLSAGVELFHARLPAGSHAATGVSAHDAPPGNDACIRHAAPRLAARMAGAAGTRLSAGSDPCFDGRRHANADACGGRSRAHSRGRGRGAWGSGDQRATSRVAPSATACGHLFSFLGCDIASSASHGCRGRCSRRGKCLRRGE